MDAIEQALAERIRTAGERGERLRVRGGGSKDFYGNSPQGELLGTHGLTGIVGYEPSELVVTARAGTPLRDIEDALAAQGQMLSFEPPHFGAGATLGGCVAAGLAGPRRAATGTAHGGVRDFVLGAKLLDGRGQLLTFGGTVMKNVAGYDVSRLLAGSLGALGMITELSIKVLPVPACEITLRLVMDEVEALRRLNEWGGQPLPLSASCWHDGTLWLRLSGASPAVRSAAARIGGETISDPQAIEHWRALREQTHAFFAGSAPLWRLSLPTTAPPLQLDAAQLIEWGGGLRWVRSALPLSQVRLRAAALGGSATLFRGGDRSQGVFAPLSPALLVIHQRLRNVFDPQRVFDGGRLYPEL